MPVQASSRVSVEGSTTARAGNAKPAVDYDNSPMVRVSFPYVPSITTSLDLSIEASGTWDGHGGCGVEYQDTKGYHDLFWKGVTWKKGAAVPNVGYGDIVVWTATVPLDPYSITNGAIETEFQLHFSAGAYGYVYYVPTGTGNDRFNPLVNPVNWTVTRTYTPVAPPVVAPVVTAPVAVVSADEIPTGPFNRASTLTTGPGGSLVRFG